ncbi:MAG: hypothetical protein ACKODX_12470, partial [Gemmata sp.]
MVARGASACLLAAVAATAFVLLLDALVTLPAAARGLFVAVWATALGVLVWRLVVRPWQADIPLAEVARELARRAPELAERLETVVGAPAPETSPGVRAALAADAARRAKRADLAGAIPTYPAKLAVCGALIALLGFLIAAGVVPGSADRLRRVLLPWSRTPGAGGRVVVTSGEPVVRRGGPVTLTAYAQSTDANAPVPSAAVLVSRAGPGAPEERVPMTADGAGAFHATRAEVPGDFEYRVQIGAATSEWLRVTALDPVELAAGTRIEVVPPAYTGGPKEARGFERLLVPEHSALTLHLKFTRPPALAHLDWHPNGEARSSPLALELGPDRLSGTATFRVPQSGALRLALASEVGGKKLRTTEAVDVNVVPDRAPWFEAVSGLSPRPRAAR